MKVEMKTSAITVHVRWTDPASHGELVWLRLAAALLWAANKLNAASLYCFERCGKPTIGGR